MIAYIKGILTEKLEHSVVIESNGIGYEIHVPLGSSIYLSETGDEIICHTYMAVREDDISLYGFSDRKSLALFRLLLTVSGIGAKAALSILSSMDTAALANAIALEDAAALTKAQGIGKKTAQRIVLELKDKVEAQPASADGGDSGNAVSDSKLEAVSALMSLGYGRSEALGALAGIEAATTEEYIRKALSNLL